MKASRKPHYYMDDGECRVKWLTGDGDLLMDISRTTYDKRHPWNSVAIEYRIVLVNGFWSEALRTKK